MTRLIQHRRPVAIDLFAGAGGLSLGLEEAGFDVLAAVEYDAVHAATHAFNFPHSAVICDDVSVLTGSAILAAAAVAARNLGSETKWNGEVDLVAGGPPCQGFSWIGQRRVDDARNDLIFHFFRLVNELRPRFFMMENVPGIASGAHRDLLADLIRRFGDAGYHVYEPQIVNAAQYGVPQDRRRFILVGRRRDVSGTFRFPAPSAKPVRAVRSTVHTADGLPDGPTVWDAIGDLPDADTFNELRTSDAVQLGRKALASMEVAQSGYARRLSGTTRDPLNFGYERKWVTTTLTSSARTIHTLESIRRFSRTEQGKVEPISRFLRLPEQGLCNTLRAGTGSERGAHTSPRPIHPRLARVLTVREAARLHSFPDWFRLHITKWHGFRQVGNAVPPLLGRALGSAVLDALGVSPQKPATILELGDPRLLRYTMSEAAVVMSANFDALPKTRSRRIAS